jgi:hypothetical protein
MPVNGVMLLGHNLDSESAFERTLERGGEDVEGMASAAADNGRSGNPA